MRKPEVTTMRTTSAAGVTTTVRRCFVAYDGFPEIMLTETTDGVPGMGTGDSVLRAELGGVEFGTEPAEPGGKPPLDPLTGLPDPTKAGGPDSDWGRGMLSFLPPTAEMRVSLSDVEDPPGWIKFRDLMCLCVERTVLSVRPVSGPEAIMLRYKVTVPLNAALDALGYAI